MLPTRGSLSTRAAPWGVFAFEMTANAILRSAWTLPGPSYATRGISCSSAARTIALKEEGFGRAGTAGVARRLGHCARVEFLVADALHLPFAADTIASFASLNLLAQSSSAAQTSPGR
jgi:hypothetical protein